MGVMFVLLLFHGSEDLPDESYNSLDEEITIGVGSVDFICAPMTSKTIIFLTLGGIFNTSHQPAAAKCLTVLLCLTLCA